MNECSKRRSKRCTLKLSTVILLMAIGFAPTLYAAPSEAATPSITPENLQLIDRIAAIVNDDIILLSDLKNAVSETQAQLQAKGVRLDPLVLEKKVLDQLILEKLQLQKAKQLGIQVTDDEVANQLQVIAKQNHLTLEQLRNALNHQLPNGFATFRNKIKKERLIQKLRQKVVLKQTQVTEEEIDNFIQRSHLQQDNWQYHIGHIMLALPESANAEQRKKLEAQMNVIRQKLLQGEDFSQIAVRYSQGSKALEGGDLGWLNGNELPTFFAQQIPKLKQGEISPIIKSPVGYHLIKLLGKRNQNTPQDQDERTQALQSIRLRKVNEVLEPWLRQLRDEAYVDIKLPELTQTKTNTETHS